MTRFLAVAALTAALGTGCNSSEGGVATPTGPTTTTPAPPTGGGGSPVPQSCLPAAPGNLKVTVTDSMRVFTWNSVSGVQDYFIQIARVGNDEFIINTNTSQTTYTWTGAAPGSYWARVYGRNSCGSGPNSEQVFFN